MLEFNLEVDDSRLQTLIATEAGTDLVGAVRDLFADLEVATTIRAVIGDHPDLKSLADGMLTTDRSGNNLRPVRDS